MPEIANPEAVKPTKNDTKAFLLTAVITFVLTSVVIVAFLALTGPAVGNIFSNIVGSL